MKNGKIKNKIIKSKIFMRRHDDRSIFFMWPNHERAFILQMSDFSTNFHKCDWFCHTQQHKD